MADVSKIKLPDGTTYSIKDTVSGYITPSDIADKTDKLIVHLGDPIGGDFYQIDKTYQQIGWAVLNGNHLLFSDGNAVYPYLGFGNIDGTVLIGFGFSATYNGTAMLHGYAVLQNNTAMKLNSFTVIPANISELINDSGFITNETESDPVFSASAASGITASDITNWNNKTSNTGTITSVKTTAGTHTAIDVSSGAASFNVPTKTSHLTNDSGFITSYTETDPTVPSWAKESIKPTYTASEVGAIRGNVGGVFYGTCPTAAGTVEKAVTCAEFTADDLKAGTIIVVSFSATNSGAVANLKLNVNGTGAKSIKYINNGTLGNLTSAGYLKANTEYPFYFDGTNWVVWFNYNTTYSALSEADMHTGTATTARTITAQRLKQAVEYHAPVTSVNGNTGAVAINVPTTTGELTNNGDGGSPFATYNYLIDNGYVTAMTLANPTFCATDATSQAVLQQAFGATAEIVVPSNLTSTTALLYKLEPRTWFCWMNGAEMEFARLSVSANTSTSTITLYLRGRTSIATGEMGVDSSWTVTPLASDAEGVAY